MSDIITFVVGLLLFQVSLHNVSSENAVKSTNPNGTKIVKSTNSDTKYSRSSNATMRSAKEYNDSNSSDTTMSSAKESTTAKGFLPDNGIPEKSGRRFFLLKNLKNLVGQNLQYHTGIIGRGSYIQGSSAHHHKILSSNFHGAREGQISGVLVHPLGSLNIKISGSKSFAVQSPSSHSNILSSQAHRTIQNGQQLSSDIVEPNINSVTYDGYNGGYSVSHGAFGAGSHLINQNYVHTGIDRTSHNILQGSGQSTGQVIHTGSIDSTSQGILHGNGNLATQGVIQGSLTVPVSSIAQNNAEANSHSLSHSQVNSQLATQGVNTGSYSIVPSSSIVQNDAIVNSHSTSHGAVRGNSQLPTQGVNTGSYSIVPSSSIVQNDAIVNSHSISHGAVQGNSQLATQGVITGSHSIVPSSSVVQNDAIVNSYSTSHGAVQGNSQLATQGGITGSHSIVPSSSIIQNDAKLSSQSISHGTAQGNNQLVSQVVITGSHSIVPSSSIVQNDAIVSSHSTTHGAVQGNSQIATQDIVKESHSQPSVILAPAVSSSAQAKHSSNMHNSFSQSSSHSVQTSGTFGHSIPSQTVVNVVLPEVLEYNNSGQQSSVADGTSSHSAAQSSQTHGAIYGQQIQPSFIYQPSISRTMEINQLQNGFHHQSSQASSVEYNANSFAEQSQKIQMLIPAEINSYLALGKSQPGQLMLQQYRPNIQYYLSQLGSNYIMKNIMAIKNIPSFLSKLRAGQHNIHLSNDQLATYKSYLMKTGLINLEPYQLLFSGHFRQKLPTLHWTVVEVSPSELCKKPCSKVFKRNAFFSLPESVSILPLKLLMPALQVRSGVTKATSGAGSIAMGFGEISQGVFRALKNVPSQATQFLKSEQKSKE